MTEMVVMSEAHPDVWRVEITVLLPVVEAYEAALEPFVDAVSWFLADPDADERDEASLWRLEGFSRTPIDRTLVTDALDLTAAALGGKAPVAIIEQVTGTDWVSANMRSFTPILAGRFFVHGSHFTDPLPGGTIGLLIDAGTAFGSGEHATTFGCLTAIDHLLHRRRFRRPLDLGCGSGILAIAIAKATGNKVTAADIDPVSVKVAAENARRNGVGGRITTLVSDGYRSRGVARRRPYDLIVANILARPLVSMAKDLARHLAGDGICILSGLLARQERLVLSAHRAQGLSLLGRLTVNGWTTLVLARSPRNRL
jgi:ribosomal protein L11 methyltransferase